MRRLASACLFAIALVVASPAAFAEKTASIAEFAGAWVGRSEPGSDRQRAATVLIEMTGDKEFRVTWASFEADPPGSGNVTERQRSITFNMSKQAGVWLAKPGDDPFENLAGWARVEGRSLIVNTAALRPDGRLERQSYKRTLTADGLKLSYRRWIDEDLDREIDAEFLPLVSEAGKKRG